MSLFDKFENRTVIKGVLVAVDPIHIGASEKTSLDPVGVDEGVLKNSSGNPVIPGSSLKGVVRAYYESAVRSIRGIEAACDVMDEKKCCTYGARNDIHAKGISVAESAERAYKNSCEACRLFGGREIAGKLKFKDCYAIIPEGMDRVLTEFRDGVGIDRDTGSAKKGAKYDYEIVPKGTKFDFCLIADNLDEGQKKALEFIIRYLCSEEMAVGGKTTRGLGRVRLEITERTETTADMLREQLGL